MIRAAVEGYTWDSHAMLAADLAADGTVIRANATLQRMAGGRLAGRAFVELIATAQREAFERRVAAAGPEWTSGTFAFAARGAEIASDRCVWLRRVGDAVLLVAEPAVGEQEQLVEKVLELNDELVSVHRDLLRQRKELRAANERIRNLEAISAAGLQNLRLDELLDEILRLIAAAVDAPRAVLLLRDEREDVLVARAAVGLEGLVELSDVRVPIGVGVAGTIAAENRPRVVPDLSEIQVHSSYLREYSRSLAGVPLRLEGQVIGVLHVNSDQPNRFSEDDLSLLIPAAERAALAIARARIVERERGIAETLQRSLLPRSLPAVQGLELEARFTPGASVEVGGDWYDALPLPGGRLACVIGDVAGKGLRAASLMGELRAGLRAYAIEGGGPIETLARLDRLASRSMHMATAVLMQVDPASGEAEFGSAGHLPPLLVRADGSAVFLAGGASAPLLAFHDDVPPGTAALDPGDRVVLYTDGLVERRWEVIDDSLERLRSSAEGFDGGLDELCDHLMDSMRAPAGTPQDDIAMLAVARS
jgi:sigma-B regulation protein RsbU (phosphoserine phosphatase)